MILGRVLFPAFLAFISFTAGAEASPFSLRVTGATGSDGSVDFTLTGDNTSSTGGFMYTENEQAPNFLDFLSTSFTDPNATFAISNVMRSFPYPGVETASANFVVSDPNFAFVVDDTNGSSQSITGYTLRFFAQITYDPQTGMQFGGSASSDALIIPPPSVLQADFSTVVVTGSPFSPVPLPASAPLFGAGLLALAGVGYASRCKRAAAT